MAPRKVSKFRYLAYVINEEVLGSVIIECSNSESQMKFSISLLSNITYVVPQEIYCPNWYELLIMRAFNETTKILKRNFIPCQYFPSNFLSPVRLKKQCQWNCSLSCFSDFSPVWLLVAPEGARWSWIAESERKGQIVLLPRCLPPFFLVSCWSMIMVPFFRVLLHLKYQLLSNVCLAFHLCS